MGKQKMGFVSLVGAGPGAPELLTLKGQRALRHCEVVIYDYLVNEAILKWAKDAQKIYVGKRSGKCSHTKQKSIGSLMVRLAKRGRAIVRLKGGDPFVFGRGGEEALVLARNKIPFEIVPGVSAGFAVPAYAGIPVTHRGLASSVTFITAHEDPRKSSARVNWKKIASLDGTLVLFMGVHTLNEMVKILLKHGKKQETPVTLIRWGTTSRQEVVEGTLRTIASQARKENIKPPTLVVIGAVSRLRQTLNWFQKKSLAGKHVLITRPKRQAERLENLLKRFGAHVTKLPTIEILKSKNPKLIDKAIRRLGQFDWIVFTSENGVRMFFDRFNKTGLGMKTFNRLRIVSIGPRTETILKSYRVTCDLVPKVFTTDGLLSSFRKYKLKGQRFLLLRANIAPRRLRDELTKMGAVCDEVPVYETKKPKDLPQQIAKTFQSEKIDFVTFTSASTAVHFFESLPNGRRIDAKVISIGPVTSEAVRTVGGTVAREAKSATIDSLVSAIVEDAAFSAE
jgi:uroporphyrinogen III methyltransferase / synthase